jgi:hypothetical protein
MYYLVGADNFIPLVTVSTEVYRWRKRKIEKGLGLRLREKKALGMLWLLYRTYCWKRKYKLYLPFARQ